MAISQPSTLRTAVVTAAVMAAAVGLGVAVIVVSGLYNIAADAPHARPVAFLVEQLRDRSIARYSQDVTVPNLDDPTMIAEGAEHYAAMCVGCHLAPGVTDSEIRPGLYPEPPNLVAEGIDEPKEAFWVVKHGIKMSGMPAWGRTHDDAAIWNIVAFLRKMPSMSSEAYRALAGSASEDSEESDGHDAADEPGTPPKAPRPRKT